MKTNVDEMLSKMTEFLKNEAKTETVIGQQFKLGQFDCVPVIRIGFGIGGGEGGGTEPRQKLSGEGLGVGGGIGIEPVGFLVSRADEIHFVAAKQAGGLAVAMEKFPEVLEKYFEHQKNKSTATA